MGELIKLEDYIKRSNSYNEEDYCKNDITLFVPTYKVIENSFPQRFHRFSCKGAYPILDGRNLFEKNDSYNFRYAFPSDINDIKKGLLLQEMKNQYVCIPWIRFIKISTLAIADSGFVLDKNEKSIKEVDNYNNKRQKNPFFNYFEMFSGKGMSEILDKYLIF